MITGYGIALMVVAGLGAVLSFVETARKRGPNDFTMGAALVTALMLLAQIVISIAAPFAGNAATGDPLEFWMYLIVAFFLPVGAGFWALVDRTRWANLVLGVVQVSIVVMTYRMLVIWG
ncbi:hypothetical protein [Leucobacter luti]|uniref:Integral membrane protein n=1 Tax=Leucobacter luti TaxID=340320 RepID=A0A4Q7U1V0_9MICO|nr:hypothetical protein [Leucobacter luti]MBL3698913.1 hypothetical protein [Leucobacter luti]RZT66292.1 hypothetical protein EV139_1728 [Leucobacter luti]